MSRRKFIKAAGVGAAAVGMPLVVPSRLLVADAPSKRIRVGQIGCGWLDASDKKLLDPEGVTVQFPHSLEHHKNWLECVISRQTPLAPAPIAHRANAACILSWIAMKLARTLTWDAKAEWFVNDDEANSMLSRPERAPYGAMRLAKSVA